jgi:hypothetical protein
VEPEGEAQAGRSLRPRKGISYTMEEDDSEYESTSQKEASSAEDGDEDDDRQVRMREKSGQKPNNNLWQH